MRFHGCSGHRHALLWSRAAGPACLVCRPAWRAGLLGVPAGGGPRSVACSTAGVPGTVTPYCGAGLPGVPVGSGPRSVACSTAGVPGTVTPYCGAGLPGVPVGSGPRARRPRRELCSARRLEARPGPTPTHRHHSQAPHDFWYCYVASRVFQAPPAPSTPVALGMLTYGLAHHPEARVGTASTHRHGSRTPLPRCRLFLSGVTPFSWALHHFPGGVMLPNWCNAP